MKQLSRNLNNLKIEQFFYVSAKIKSKTDFFCDKSNEMFFHFALFLHRILGHCPRKNNNPF